MKVLTVRSSHKNSNSKKKQSQFSIIFILASQYRSHFVPLNSAVHCPKWFLSMGSLRLHSMQLGSGRIPVRWRRVPKQSCPTHSRNSATAFLLGQSGILAISCFHGLWESLVPSSCLYTLWNTCFKCSLIVFNKGFVLIIINCSRNMGFKGKNDSKTEFHRNGLLATLGSNFQEGQN